MLEEYVRTFIVQGLTLAVITAADRQGKFLADGRTDRQINGILMRLLL